MLILASRHKCLKRWRNKANLQINLLRDLSLLGNNKHSCYVEKKLWSKVFSPPHLEKRPVLHLFSHQSFPEIGHTLLRKPLKNTIWEILKNVFLHSLAHFVHSCSFVPGFPLGRVARGRGGPQGQKPGVWGGSRGAGEGHGTRSPGSGEGRGARSPKWTGNTSWSTAVSDSSASYTKTRPSKVGDVVTPPGPWTTCGPLSRGCIRSRTFLANVSCDILHTWPNQRTRNLSIRWKSSSAFRALWISPLRTLQRSVTLWIRANHISAACTLDSIISVISQDS